MRLVMVVPRFPQLSETFIVSKFLGLLDKGWDVHILCVHSDLAQWQNYPTLLDKGSAIRKRVHVTWPTEPRWLAALLIPFALLRCLLFRPVLTWRYLSLGFRRFGQDILRRLYLDAEMIHLQPEIIHFEFGALAVGRTYLKELLGTHLTLSFRGHDLEYSGIDDPDFYKEVWLKADSIHLLGEGLWKRAQARGCPSTMAHMLIPPSIDPARMNLHNHNTGKESQIPDRPLRILSVGRIVWVKGYEYALQAIKMLVDGGVPCCYRVIGDGDLFEGICFACHQLGLEDTVEFPGSQNPDTVFQQMEWADVFLQSSVQEGFCNAVLEAQAKGLPVVCSDAGGLPENVEDGVTGFVVPRRDPAALAEKLALLASDPQLRERMGKAGRERVETLFTLPVQMDRWDAFYRQVLSMLAGDLSKVKQ